MLLEKVYQPDIMAYEEGRPGAMFVIEVVENPAEETEAERAFVRFMANSSCYHGALVSQGRIQVLDVFPTGAGLGEVKVLAEIAAGEELKRFGAFAGADWKSEENFFDWLQTYIQRERADSLSLEDQALLRQEFLPWLQGAQLNFTSLRGKSIGRAF